MKIALAQLNYHIGNFEQNTMQIIQAINEVKLQQVDLVVFAELAICGYPPLDFLDYPEFIVQCEKAINQVAQHCTDIACVIGSPSKNPAIKGKDLFNSAYFIQNGKITAIVNKALLPTYDVFDEYRYFEPETQFKCIQFQNKKIALTICEDLWNTDDDPLYRSSPMDTLIQEQPDMLINIAASPFSYIHDDERIQILSNNAKKYNLPLLYVNQVGAQTELIFDGGSLAFNQAGELVDEMPYFAESLKIYEFNEGKIQHLQPVKHQPDEDIKQIHDALILGIQDYFKKSDFSQAVLGLSGGIDSAVVCALACEALGAENVMSVLMPSKFSTDHSIDDALALVKNIGCKHEIIPIKEAAQVFEHILQPIFNNLPFDITEENIQARCRAIILMAMSNKFKYILLNTSNKSECAVGYGTLYGDMAGAISVLGDVYKTQVFQLARYINRKQEIIPQNTIIKPPSAELRPDQKDADSLPPYDVLDNILYQHIEQKKSLETIIEAGYDANLVKRILLLVNKAEFKRYQTPPILRVSSKAFGLGRRMPIVGKYLS